MRNSIRQIIGANLRYYRKKCGFSQERLAFTIKMDEGYINKLEQGKVNVSADSLQKIAAGLKVQPYLLLKPPNRLLKNST